MTTTTDQATAWFDQLVPAERREEGARLLEEVRAIRAALVPLVPRLAAHLEWADQASTTIEGLLAAGITSDTAYEVSDDIANIVGTLSHALALNAALSNMGFDPDHLPETIEEAKIR